MKQTHTCLDASFFLQQLVLILFYYCHMHQKYSENPFFLCVLSRQLIQYTSTIILHERNM